MFQRIAKPFRISIHALLAESDSSIEEVSKYVVISIHALLAESDAKLRSIPVLTLRFLSTLSLRRATTTRPRLCIAKLNFYPRSPCGERPTNHDQEASNQTISIHALLAESDGFITTITICIVLFLSTLSLRRATPASQTNLPGRN